MAHKESELLSLNEKYTLDKYEFTLKTREIPQTNLMDVIATATGPKGKMGAKTVQISKDTEVSGWYVDANSTTADIYLAVKEPTETSADYTYLGQTVHTCEPADLYMAFADKVMNVYGHPTVTGESKIYGVSCGDTPPSIQQVLYSDSDFSGTYLGYGGSVNQLRVNHGITPKGVSYYSAAVAGSFSDDGMYSDLEYSPIKSVIDTSICEYADVLFLGRAEPLDYSEKDELIGRFAIDLRPAGGTEGDGGTDDGWIDPEDGQPTIWPGDPDYPDPEDPDYPGGDEPYYPPSKTLYLEVEGALSGRHNDPLHDTSYSYVPADKATVKPYGYGGDGGHGGGGGAGSSTVIMYKFATDKADSKEIIVKPKRHGYGSGGGKGGKGGDGCILIYY